LSDDAIGNLRNVVRLTDVRKTSDGGARSTYPKEVNISVARQSVAPYHKVLIEQLKGEVQ